MSATLELPRADAPRVSVLIPVSDGARVIDLLRACLQHLGGCAGEAPFETLLLLNDVSDEVRSWVERHVRGARVWLSDVNLGLAGGLRLLRSEARGELLISIHQDTEVEQGWLRSLVETADARRDAGLIGSLLLESDGVTVQAAGWILCAEGSTFTPWWSGPPPRREAYAGQAPFGVDYVPSAALMVRSEVWDRFGGADERLYPGFYVDVDLAMGTRSLGRSVLLEPRSVARHHRGSATSLPFRRFVSLRNRAIFAKKWAGLLERFVREETVAQGVRPALERARLEAERCRLEWPSQSPRPTRELAASAFVDPDELERRCREHERAVRAEYLAFLEGRVAALEEELARRPPSVGADQGSA